MKNCPNCNALLDDNAMFCVTCGAKITGDSAQSSQQYYSAPPQGYAPAPAYAPDPFDHTSEFDPQDISDNKVIAMLVYLLGSVGIIIALLSSKDSPYAAFHVRQALKITVCEIIAGIASAILLITVLVPMAAGIFTFILQIVKIICFFQICKGQAKEPPIIKNFTFLK